MSNADFRVLMKKWGFSDNEINYFTQGIHEKPALDLIFRNLLKTKKESAILDVGCGIGLLEEGLVKKCFFNIIGLDLNKKYLQFAKYRLPSVEFILADARFLPFKNRTFDIIVIHDVCYSLNLLTILNDLVRILSQGEVYFDMPNWNFYRIFPCLLPFHGFITYRLNEVEKLLQKYGLKITGRFAVSLSRESRLKFGIPERLASFVNTVLRALPLTLHIFLCKFWFLVVVHCKIEKKLVVRSV